MILGFSASAQTPRTVLTPSLITSAGVLASDTASKNTTRYQYFYGKPWIDGFCFQVKSVRRTGTYQKARYIAQYSIDFVNWTAFDTVSIASASVTVYGKSKYSLINAPYARILTSPYDSTQNILPYFTNLIDTK